MFGKSSSSKHAVSQNDANKGKGAPAPETGGSSSQPAAANANAGSNGLARETDGGSMSQSTENIVNSEDVRICKSQLNNEGYYDNVAANWSKARNSMMDMRDLDQYGGEQYDRVFGISTDCGRIYTETLSYVSDPSQPAFRELKGATGFCATNSSCVSSQPGVINYHEDNNDYYDYYD